jgi:hypothetical protein
MALDAIPVRVLAGRAQLGASGGDGGAGPVDRGEPAPWVPREPGSRHGSHAGAHDLALVVDAGGDGMTKGMTGQARSCVLDTDSAGRELRLSIIGFDQVDELASGRVHSKSPAASRSRR